ncbi:MAG: hypothetical protein ACP5UV_00395, partial [Thermoplasmata archaeon]
FSFFGFKFVVPDIQNPIVWSYEMQISNNGPQPSAIISSGSNYVVNGNVNLSYNSSWAIPGEISGKIIIQSMAGTASTSALNGNTGKYIWNTSDLPDGYYTVSYLVTTATGVTSEHSILFYVDNSQAKLMDEISLLDSEYSQALANISSLEKQMLQAGSVNGALKEEISTLNATIDQLNTALIAMHSSYNSTVAQLTAADQQISQLNSQNSAYSNEISTLNVQLNQSLLTIQSQKSQITNLQNEVSQLQQKVSSMKSAGSMGTTSILAYGDGVFGIIGIISLAGAGSAGVFIKLYRKKK